MKALLAIVAGFGASLGMFAGGLAFAVYLLAVEPERQPGPSVDVADLWSAEPRKVDKAAQDFERLPPATVPGPERTAEEAAPVPAPAPTPGQVDDFDTGSVQAAAGEDAGAEPAEPAFTDELSAAHRAWCAERYRSYRPADDSYTSYSGAEQPCVSPFSGDMAAASGAAASDGAPSWVAESYPELLEEPAVQYDSDGTDAFAPNDALASDAFASDDHVSYCFSRYRSYRPEDNSYQPYGGGPRRQCR